MQCFDIPLETSAVKTRKYVGPRIDGSIKTITTFSCNMSKILDSYPLTATFGPESKKVDSELETKFTELADQWSEETKFCSSVNDMFGHIAYQNIMRMGPKAVPLILKRIETQPDYWFFALECLTGEDPVPSEERLNFDAITNAWLEWGHMNDKI